MKTLYDKLCEVDEGRFKPLIDTLDVKAICESCHHFNNKLDKTYSYRCRCAGSCIDATLNSKLKDYLLLNITIEK